MGIWRNYIVKNEQFIFSFKEKLRKLDDMQNPADCIGEKMRRILLQNAVEQIPSLKHVSSTDAYQRILTKARSVSYDQYFELLHAA